MIAVAQPRRIQKKVVRILLEVFFQELGIVGGNARRIQLGDCRDEVACRTVRMGGDVGESAIADETPGRFDESRRVCAAQSRGRPSGPRASVSCTRAYSSRILSGVAAAASENSVVRNAATLSTDRKARA